MAYTKGEQAPKIEKTEINPKGAGKHQAVIDKDIFEKLCKIQCTQKEIEAVLEISQPTLELWCEKEYGKKYCEVADDLASGGKASLRRIQLKLAEHNPAMAIWLGKQYLGQKDKQEIDVSDLNIQVVNDVPKTKK